MVDLEIGGKWTKSDDGVFCLTVEKEKKGYFCRITDDFRRREDGKFEMRNISVEYLKDDMT